MPKHLDRPAGGNQSSAQRASVPPAGSRVEPVVIGDCTLYCGDATEVLPTLDDCIADALLTDPPAGIGFMGKEWDDFRRGRNQADAGRENVFGRTSARGPEYGRRGRDVFIEFLSSIAAVCRRVMKPGAYGLVWAIPRTSHWTGTALEDAGFEIRDRIAHLFGQGFPKAKSCLKPACEDWWLVRNPGDGVDPLPGLDECRIEFQSEEDRASAIPQGRCTSKPGALAGGVQHNGERKEFVPRGRDGEASAGRRYDENGGTNFAATPGPRGGDARGRWPANVVLDEHAAALLDEQTGVLESGKPSGIKAGGQLNCYGTFAGGIPVTGFGDAGGASRFFYCSKASAADRGDDNTHPTVKPLDLMLWLATLITPADGLVIDPFMGSGTTGIACAKRGLRFIGIEKHKPYFDIACRRIREAYDQFALFNGGAP